MQNRDKEGLNIGLLLDGENISLFLGGGGWYGFRTDMYGTKTPVFKKKGKQRFYISGQCSPRLLRDQST
jgi:hypothetical protein